MYQPINRPSVPADLEGVIELPGAAVVHELVAALGAQLVAAIAGVTETRRVRAWERGEHPQRIDTLRTALQVTRVIIARSSAASAKAWFTGTVPALDYVSPLEVLRENTSEARTRVLRAAVAFAQR